MYFFKQLNNYVRLTRLHKPIGIFLLLWPTIWALLIAAQGEPSSYITFIFVIGVILMRSAGCIINDIADRNFDGHVARTLKRPLVTGNVSLRGAIILFTVLCLISFALVLTLNLLTVLLAIPAILLAASYPFMKRYTNLPQIVLGFAFSWGIPMAFSAQAHYVPPITWILMAANLCWVVAYDTIYAMVDREDDLRIGIKSTAILFGHYDRLIIALLQCAMITLLLLIGHLETLNFWYDLSICVAIILIMHQQWLMRARKPQRCFQAFLNNHWVGLVVALGLLLGYIA